MGISNQNGITEQPVGSVGSGGGGNGDGSATVPTLTLTPNGSSFNEGDTAEVTLALSRALVSGETMTFDVAVTTAGGSSSGDFALQQTSGMGTVTSNAASVTLTGPATEYVFEILIDEDPLEPETGEGFTVAVTNVVLFYEPSDPSSVTNTIINVAPIESFFLLLEDSDGDDYILIEGTTDRIIHVDNTAPLAVNHVIINGQSNGAASECKPALSKSQPYGNLMLNTGVRAGDGSTAGFWGRGPITGVLPLVEDDDMIMTGGETCASGFANYLSRVVPGHRLIMTNNARDGVNIAGLDKPSASYTDGLAHTTAAKTYCGNPSMKTLAMLWIHGESDAQFAITTYKSAMLNYYNDLNTDIKSITGQTENIKIIATCQRAYDVTYSGATDLQMVELAVENPDKFVFMGPWYFMPSGIHMRNVHQRWIGQMFAKVYKHVIIDGLTWEPFRVTSAVINGSNLVTATINPPSGDFVFDFENVQQCANYGFYCTDTGVSITSVTKLSSTTIGVQLSGTPAGGSYLSYAWFNATAGASAGGGQNGQNNKGKQGNVRDTDTAVNQFDDIPLYNWLSPSRVLIT